MRLYQMLLLPVCERPLGEQVFKHYGKKNNNGSGFIHQFTQGGVKEAEPQHVNSSGNQRKNNNMNDDEVWSTFHKRDK